jgi:serine/threonine-protein kinase RsbW
MTFDDVDDVRIAAEEAFVYACDHASDADMIDMTFSIDENVFEIRVAIADLSRVADEDVERRAAYATFILQSVCDHFEMSSDAQGPYLRVVKSISAELADADG